MTVPYSALQPVRFSVNEVSVRPNPDFKPTPGITHLPQVQLNVDFGEGTASDGQPIFRYRLRIAATSPGPDAPVPFDVHVAVVGHFTVAHDAVIEGEALRRMAALNGLAMLYGFARDVVILQTTASDQGSLMLPALNLSQFAEEILASRKEPETEAAAPTAESSAPSA